MVKKALFFFISLVKGREYYARKIGVKVGSNCRIYTYRFGSEPFLVSIGNRVTVTKGVTFITHDGSTCLVRDADGRRFIYKKVEIGDDVFIGMNSIIMPGVRIGNNVIIAAGSVVTKSVPDNSVIGGNPAKFLVSFDQYSSKVLNYPVSEKSLEKLNNLAYKERVLMVVDNTFKDYIRK